MRGLIRTASLTGKPKASPGMRHLPCSFTLPDKLRGRRAARAAGAAPPHPFTCDQTCEITTDPSPTAEATRLTDPARTSPTA